MSSYDLSIPDELFYEQLFKDYQKTKKELEEYVEIMQEWGESQQHLPETPPRYFYQYALLVSKFSVERAKGIIDMYYTIRSLMPEIFCTHPMDPDMRFHRNITYFIPLPKPTKDLHRVIYVSINPNANLEHFDHEKLIAFSTHIVDLIIQTDRCYNFEMIFDLKHCKLVYAHKLSLMVAKKTMTILEKVYGNRLAAVHVVNFMPVFESIINTIFMPFLPQKIKGRVHFYPDSDVLLTKFDKDILPKDVGGNGQSLAELQEQVNIKLEEDLKPRFDHIYQLKVDESLRPAKLQNDDVLGYYGSFKKISID